MSSKRDNIKKALGITEYPWSSDDEDQSGMLDLHLLRRQTAEPRLSVSDMPGISGLAPRPSTSSSSSVPTRRSQTQAKMDRALYWSALNNAKKAAALGVSRLSDVPMSCLSRSVTHTPAAELRGRGERSNPRADIQRVLAFKKLTSTLNNLRQSNANSNLYSMSSRGNTGPLLPSEVSSNARSPMIPDEVHAICSRMKTSHEPSSCRSGTTNARMSRGVRTGEEPLAASYAASRSRALHPNSPGAGHGSAAPALPRVNIGNTDEETENPGGSTSLPIERDEINLDRSAEVVASSGGGIILEEEIVEVQAPEEVTAAVHHDAIDHTEEPDNPVTNEVIISQSAEPLAQQHHGLKRKRESHDDADPGPVSVNEFNQDLLRLLECPVCLEWMEPPMSQCRRGHLVCGRCRERLAACPVCRTTFSSVRNRAMEGVAELLRYPCRHGCGRELRLRRRAPHEASCGARKYTCPAPLCTDRQPLARADLGPHFQSKHLQMVRIGNKHKFSIKVNFEQHENWLIFAWDEYFHLRIDVDIRTWGVIVYVAYIGPKWNCTNFNYEVSLGDPNSRRLIYSRVTHSDLESPTVNVSRQDCFHLTIDQALNFLRFKNRHCEPDKYLDFNLQITNLQQTPMDSRES